VANCEICARRSASLGGILPFPVVVSRRAYSERSTSHGTTAYVWDRFRENTRHGVAPLGALV